MVSSDLKLGLQTASSENRTSIFSFPFLVLGRCQYSFLTSIKPKKSPAFGPGLLSDHRADAVDLPAKANFSRSAFSLARLFVSTRAPRDCQRLARPQASTYPLALLPNIV